MKPQKLAFYVLITSAVIWLTHTLIDFVLLRTAGFIDLLILQVPVNVLYFRLFLITLLVFLAIFLYYDLKWQNFLKQVDLRLPESMVGEERSDYGIISGFFHSVRTQLNNIVGFTNLLINEARTEEEIDAYLKHVESSKTALLKSMDSLIKEYRELKLPEKGIILPGKEIETDWRTKTILIAEDVQSNYMLLNYIFRKTGVNIIWVKTGVEAVNTVKEADSIHLILMDILMPEMDGIEATKQIRQIKPEIPVIAQTAYSFSRDEISLDLFNDYLFKPIWEFDLLQKCTRYLC